MNKLPHLFIALLIWSTSLLADQQIPRGDTDDSNALAVEGRWRLVTDGIMGGVSRGRLERDIRDGKECLRLSGEVSLENNGGFIQATLDLDARYAAKAPTQDGITIQVYGNDHSYGLHLRTTDLWLPWQSYRARFVAPAQWTQVRLPFDRFQPYKTGKPLNVSRLRGMGVLAIGEAFEADICIGEVAFYSDFTTKAD